MGDKKPEWSDYAYDSESISKRLGISKEEVKELKAEAAKKSQEDVEVTIKKIGGAGVGLNIDKDDPLSSRTVRVDLKVPGFGVSYDTEGGGEIDIAGFIKIETVRLKCFYVQRFYFANQYLYSDIQRVDSEECQPEPEPEPEPEPDPSLNDIEPEPKPPKSPKIPLFAEPFTGFYSGKKTVYVKETDPEIGYIAEYKGIVSSYINRLELHPDPFSDIWEIKYIIVTSTLVRNSPNQNTYPDRNVSYKRISKRYYCLNPRPLTSKGEILFINRRYYYKTVSDQNEIYFNFYRNNTQNTPYGLIGFSDELDGKSYVETFFDNGYWCGGQAGGNTQSVAFLLRGRILENVKSDYYTYYYIYENNQIINFLNLVPKQKINNPPILIQGDKMSEDCCRVVRKIAKRLAIEKYPLSLSPKEIEDYSDEMNKRIKEEPNKKIDFEDYVEFCKFKDLIQQQLLRDIAKSTGVDEFKKEKDSSEGNPLFWYFKYLKLIASGIFEASMSFKDWIASGKPGLSNDNSQSGSEDKIDNIPKLLAEQNRLTEDIHRILGIDAFPASMPKSFISKVNDQGEVTESSQVSLANYAELFGWYVDQFDALMGQWSIDILVKDEDPLTAGDQSKRITLPNLSEAIAEIYGLVLQQNINTTTSVNFESRILPEVGLTRQAVVRAFRAIETIIDYLGVEVVEKEELIQHTFDPNGESLDQILGDIPEKAPVKIYEFDYQNGITLKAALRDLAIAGNIIKGVFARRLDVDGSDPSKIDEGRVQEQIKKHVKDMEKNERTIRKDAKKDWKNFKKTIEDDGFKIEDK